MKNSKCVVRCGGLVWRGLMAASIVAGIVCLGAGNVGAAEPEQVFASGYGPWSVRNPNDMGVSVTAWGDGSGMRDVGGISMSIGQTISLSGSAREFHSATFYFSVQSFDPEVGPGSVVDPRTYLRFYEPIFVPLDDPRSQWIVYGEDEDTYYNYGQLQARLGSGEDPWLRDAEWNYVR